MLGMLGLMRYYETVVLDSRLQQSRIKLFDNGDTSAKGGSA